MTVRNMTKGNPLRLILAVALPLMLGNVFQQLYTVVDAQVVGRVEGVSALAALGSSDWLNWLFLGVLLGLSQGFAIPIAQSFGAEDYAELRKYLGNALVLAAITSAIIMVVALVSIQPALILLESPAAIRPIATSYLLVLFSAFPVVMAYNFLAGVLRSFGDGKSPLVAMVIASLLNIVLDIAFVAFFHWGVVGAAVATVIAQVCSCVYCLLRLRKLDFIHLHRADLRLDGAICGRLLRLSMPMALQNCLIALGGMLLQRIVNAMGVTFIAGYTATNKLYGVLEVAAISYGYALSTYTGQNLGARQSKRIRKGVHAGLIAGILTSLIIAAAMFLFGKPVLASFISGTEEEVAQSTKYACEYLYIASACLPILYVLYVYRSALQGMGNTLIPMCSGVAEFIMRTGSAFLLPSLIGYTGIFWAEALAWAGADLILIPGYLIHFSKIKKTCVE